MPFNGAGADEQPGSDLGVGESLSNHPSDLGFLGGEVADRLDGAFTDGLTGCGQLAGGPIGKDVGAHGGERLVGGAQLLARIEATVGAAQPLAVEQVGASKFAPDERVAEPLDRLAVVALGSGPVAE